MPISKSEASYIRASIQARPPQRADGRGLHEFRLIALQAGGNVAPLANGSGRVNVGGTEVVAAVRLEVETVSGNGNDEDLGIDGGRVATNITCSPSAYPHHTSSQLDDLSATYSTLLSSVLSSALTPSPQLTIVPNKKSWLLSTEAIVLADNGNVIDSIFIAIRAALWDLRVPRTRGVEVKAREEDSQNAGEGMKEVLREKRRVDAVDFELVDYGDEGDPLIQREALPVAITLNMTPSVSFLDATLPEEESVPDHIVFFFSFPSISSSAPSSVKGVLHGTHLIGPGELRFQNIASLLSDGEKHALGMAKSINTMLIAEDARISANAMSY